MSKATVDIASALKRYALAGVLGWQDVRQRYRRSTLGPFWLTLSMGIMIATIGLVFGGIFQTSMREFLPFLAIGLILWSFISTTITDGCVCFISAEGIIKQLPIPLFVHVLRVMWRNSIIFGHNVVIFPLVLLVVGKPLTWLALMSIPGFLLILVNLAWIVLILGVLCARYRDLPQIVNSLLQILFYLTPIMWMPTLLPARANLYLLDCNPVFYLLEIVRAPLLGQLPTLNNWVISMALTFMGWIIALFFYSRYKDRIAYWL